MKAPEHARISLQIQDAAKVLADSLAIASMAQKELRDLMRDAGRLGMSDRRITETIERGCADDPVRLAALRQLALISRLRDE